MDSATMRITIDRASGGFRVHVWMLASGELLFWSDIYSAKQNAQRAAFQLKTYAGSAVIEDLTVTELTGPRT
jgi:uncharacterized protein YegP (UPF0339 family)